MVVKTSPELVRPWRGVGPEQRVAERRERLLAAALEVFATQTFHATKVREVCKAAGLTERYFYESFAGKEELLRELARQIVDDFLAAAAPSLALAASDIDATIDGAVGAAVHSLTDDPRRARILFVEVVGVSPQLEDERREVIATLAEVCRRGVEAAGLASGDQSVEIELVARAVIGAAAEILVAYVREELPIDQEQLIDHVRRLMRRGRGVIASMNQPERSML